MLENIKSLYCTKFLLSILKEDRKLELIKYDKGWQQKLDINLIDYQLFTGNYIEYESKNKGKEYNYKGRLIYEGEFLNCRKNGKGKEYYIDDEKLIFEGEYLNGKRNGNGKEYHRKSGKLIFEGEYLNGERNGNGKEYHLNDELMFEGEFKNGKRWNGIVYSEDKRQKYELKDGNGFMLEYDYGGKWILIDKEYLQFEGEYLNGVRHGNGKEFDCKGKITFEGEYKEGKRWNGRVRDVDKNREFTLKDGNGYLVESNYLTTFFEGDIKKGERNGKGKEYGDNSIIEYEGDYLNDKKNGKGKSYHFSGNLKFEGDFKNGEKNGKGKEYDFNGNLIFEGEYLNGKKNGEGKEYNLNKEIIFEGEYLNNWRRRGKEYVKGKLEFNGEYLFNKKWNGKGYNESGDIIYEINNGNGSTRQYDDNGELKYEGGYLNGKRSGKGKEYVAGKLKFEGEFLNGKRVKKKK